jgi:hypothetical protein
MQLPETFCLVKLQQVEDLINIKGRFQTLYCGVFPPIEQAQWLVLIVLELANRAGLESLKELKNSGF